MLATKSGPGTLVKTDAWYILTGSCGTLFTDSSNTGSERWNSPVWDFVWLESVLAEASDKSWKSENEDFNQL